MKHIVTLTISNPAHEHISLRRRQSTTNYMVEARDEAEAIFRASNHFKKLGNYVHNAVIAESTLNEEAVKVGPANHDKSTDTVWHGVHHDGKEIGTIGTHSAQHVEKHGKWGFEDSRGYGRRHGEPEMNSKEEALKALLTRHKEYAKKKANEEVEQIDEISDKLLNRAKMKNFDNLMYSNDSETYKKHNDRENRLYAAGDTREARRKRLGITEPKSEKKSNLFQRIKNKLRSEEVEQIDELKQSTLDSYGEKRHYQILDRKKNGTKFKKPIKLMKKSLTAAANRADAFDTGRAGAVGSNDAIFDKIRKKESDKVLKKGTAIEKIYHNKGVGYANAQKALKSKYGVSEEVELDEANARHSPEAAQAVLTPTAKIVRAAVGKTARDKAATKKYARRVANISPDYSKKDVMDHLKSMGEEVEQIDEALDHEVNNYAKHMLNAHSADDLHVGNEHRDMAHQTLQDIKKNYGPVGVRWAEARAGEHIDSHNKAQRDAEKAIVMKRYKPTPPGAKVYQYPKSEVKEEVVNEKAPPGAKYERMVKHIKNQYSKDGTLTPQEKAIAYATAWKAKNAGK